MRLNILLLITFFYLQNTFAQVKEYQPIVSSMEIMEKKDISEKKIEGSPYLEEKFLKGLLVRNKDSINLYFRYNSLLNEVEIKSSPEDEKTYTIPKSFYTEYILEDYKLEYRSLNLEKAGIVTSYFFIYYDNSDYLFVGRPILEKTDGIEKKSGFGASKPPRYDTDIEWYIGEKNKILSKIKLKNKYVKDLFNSEIMKAYLEENKIRTEMDIVRLLEYQEKN